MMALLQQSDLDANRKPIFVIVMGVSGSGKSTIGKLLADALGIHFLDGDQLHSTSNLDKMRSGVSLDDTDRLTWLQSISQKMNEAAIKAISNCATDKRFGIVVGCSALKAKYRKILRGFCLNYDPTSTPSNDSIENTRNVHILFLKGSFEELKVRVEARSGHFMPSSLLQNQLDTLEEPTEDEQIDNEKRVRGKLVTSSTKSDPKNIVSSFLKVVSYDSTPK